MAINHLLCNKGVTLNDKLTDEQLNKAMCGACPKCLFGHVVETKIPDEPAAWILYCERCNFSYLHNLNPTSTDTKGAH